MITYVKPIVNVKLIGTEKAQTEEKRRTRAKQAKEAYIEAII